MIIGGFIFLIIGLKGAIKSMRNKEKRVDKKTGISIIVGILLVFSAILGSDVEESDEKPKDEEVVAEEKTEKKEAKKADVDKKAKEKTEKKDKKDKPKEEKADKKDEPTEELTDADRIKSVVAKEISEDRIEDVTYFDGYTTLKIRAQDNLTANMIQRSMWIDAGDIFEALKDAKYDGTAAIMFMFEMTTQYGETTDAKVMSIELSPETLNKIDFDNFDVGNFPDVSDNYFQHPSFN